MIGFRDGSPGINGIDFTGNSLTAGTAIIAEPTAEGREISTGFPRLVRDFRGTFSSAVQMCL
jgi:hypothetical protein